MKNKVLKEKIYNIFEKDKKLLLLVLIGFLGILLIVISEMNFSDSDGEDKISSQYMDSSEYCDYLEKRVENIVNSIDGAGEVRVMITLAETTEYVYAQNQNANKCFFISFAK